MPRDLDKIIAHGDELAAEFEDVDRSRFREPSSRSRLAHAAMRRAAAERDLRRTVVDAKQEGMSWEEVGMILGTSGEAARKRYGKAVGELPPVQHSTPHQNLADTKMVLVREYETSALSTLFRDEVTNSLMEVAPKLRSALWRRASEDPGLLKADLESIGFIDLLHNSLPVVFGLLAQPDYETPDTSWAFAKKKRRHKSFIGMTDDFPLFTYVVIEHRGDHSGEARTGGRNSPRQYHP